MPLYVSYLALFLSQLYARSSRRPWLVGFMSKSLFEPCIESRQSTFYVALHNLRVVFSAFPYFLYFIFLILHKSITWFKFWFRFTLKCQILLNALLIQPHLKEIVQHSSLINELFWSLFSLKQVRLLLKYFLLLHNSTYVIVIHA